MNKGLTATIIVEAQSLNYDESFGNLSVLKKLRRGSGDVFSFASRQSLRYSIVKQGVEQFGWKLGDVEPQGSGNKKVVQFKRDISIKDCEEIDLFGYMKTKKREKKKKEGTETGETSQQEDTMIRVAPARLTPAISLEPFYNDIEFLNNKWLSDRAGEDPNIANIEQHRSLYKYTVTIDLDRIGSEEHNETLDPKDRIKLLDKSDDRANRVNEFLEVIKNLYRDIRGRREDLKPLFIIGGVYPVKNPFFMNTVRVDWENGKPKIIESAIVQVLTSNYCYKENGSLKTETVKTNTIMGVRDGLFANNKKDIKTLGAEKEAEVTKGKKEEKMDQPTNSSNRGKKIEEIVMKSPEDAIDELKTKVKAFYGVK